MSEEKPKVHLSQSIIKKFEDPNYCPAKIFYCDITKKYEREATLSMDKGNYFETLVIGAGARGKIVTDLPRKKLTKKRQKEGYTVGEKTVAQLRIEAQAQNAVKIMREYGIKKPSPNYRQVNLTTLVEEYKDDNVVFDQTIDFISNINHEMFGKHPLVIFDIKLTGNVDNTYGDYCWGTPENMDHLQAESYTMFLMRHFKDLPMFKNGYVPPFIYLVFDYSPDMKYKIIPYQYDAYAENSVLDRIYYAKEKYLKEEALGWEYRPHYTQCQNCPIAKAKECPMDVTNIVI